jgi:hypothetical protein
LCEQYQSTSIHGLLLRKYLSRIKPLPAAAAFGDDHLLPKGRILLIEINACVAEGKSLYKFTAKKAGRFHMTAAEFSTAVEGLIAEARSKGLSNHALLLEIENVVSLLRERLAGGPRTPGAP